MLINEVVEHELDEYRITNDYDPMAHIRAGNRLKSQLQLIKTPLTDFEVRYKRDGDYHDYFLYSLRTGRAVGLFTIEDTSERLRILRPGIRAVTPHMALAPVAQRQGISTRAYTTFLQGGPWVFVTDEHSSAAAGLWDSLAQGNIVTFYVDGVTGQPTDQPGPGDVRVLGPRDRFKTAPGQ